MSFFGLAPLFVAATQAVPFPMKQSSSISAVINSTASAPLQGASSGPFTNTTTTASNTTATLDPNAAACQIAIPSNALTPEGLSTPWQILPPCSMAVVGQQAFAEAAVISPSGQISIYHPLIIDQGKKPAVAPVVPNLDNGAQVALFFGFNGDTLTLVDTNGQDTNASPSLAAMKCVNGLPGTKGDLFGQVSWCNTDSFWGAANAATASGQLKVPPLGTDNNGNQCLSSRSFEIIDQDQSDNLPTKYLLQPDGSTLQFTAANQKQFPQATEIDNASDEALIADFVDPIIGCTPFKASSLTDPGSMVSSLATQELQALLFQQEPIALVPLNDPDTLLTSNGKTSAAKTNAYRIGVNMPLLGPGAQTDAGSGTDYCNNMVAVQPPFLAGFQTQLTAAATPDATVGNSLFTFLANRFLQSLTNLNCPNKNIPITCQLDDNGAATSCTITALSSTGNGTTIVKSASGTGTAASVAVQSTASDLAPSSAFTLTATHSHHIKSHSLGSHTVTGSSSVTAVNTQSATGLATASNESPASSSSVPTASSAVTTNSNPLASATATATKDQFLSASSIVSGTSSTSPGAANSSPTPQTSQPSTSTSASSPFNQLGGTTLSTAMMTSVPALNLGTGPSATQPPPLSQFTTMPTSAAAAAICTPTTASLQHCWSWGGWQLCQVG